MTASLVAKRLRIPLGFLLGGAYLLFARPTEGRLLLGVGIALAGVIIRAWASGHIMKKERLVTTGPYSFVRNPLYFGSFLISVGFALAAHWALPLVVVLFFGLIYVPKMQRERATISGRFPDAYRAYAANVPVFFPRLTPWRGGGAENSAFSSALYLKHGEWKAALGYLAAVGLLYLKSMGLL